MLVSTAGTANSPIAEGYVAYFPQRWRANGVTRGSIFCHGGGGLYSDYVQTGSSLRREIPIPNIAPDCGGGWNWGNAASSTALTNAFNWLTAAKQGCKTDKVILTASSMGALPALNWAKDNASKVAAILMSVPAVDIDDFHVNDLGGYAASIETAHGGPPANDRNPAENTASFTGYPIRILYSTDDPLCRPTPVTTFGAAVGAEMISMGAIGHNVDAIYAAPYGENWAATYA